MLLAPPQVTSVRDKPTLMKSQKLHIAVELERMGDHAEGIAKLALRMVDQPLLKPLVDIPRMAEVCREMISTSLTAYVNRDVELAKAVASQMSQAVSQQVKDNGTAESV